FRPERLFVNQTVSEAFPADESTVSEMAPTSAMNKGMDSMADAKPQRVQESAIPESQGPVPVASGQFHTNAHDTKGTATIYRLANGKRVLRLTDFATSNGPDVRVYLVAATDANEPDDVKAAGFVDLGGMKGNIGDQNYDVPADLDLSKYRAVSIWCRRFSVNFGAAPLTAAP
ncbi:MAG: DM13 domain-containing protein, partial [Gemmatimonadaceae bacterium]